LLNLDRQFYSSTNTGALREFISKVKVGAKQLALRPTLILDVVSKAGLRSLWLPDRKRILIDDDIPDTKKRHAEAHEITHSLTPHHRRYLFGDDRETLRRSCHEKLEAEANFGSGQLLFLQDRFVDEARDSPRTIQAVRSLATAFGNTITMTLWHLIEEADEDEAVFGVISGHPRRGSAGFDPTQPCRYFIESPGFRARFGNTTESTAFTAIRGYASSAAGGPLGEGEAVFESRNGQRHVFTMETFFNRYEALTLGVHRGLVRPQLTVA
jgi:hypothetical protein